MLTYRHLSTAPWGGLLGSTQAGTRTIEGRIVGVLDGDTITLLDAAHGQHKIRLDGIDAPELGQPFGRASKQHLSDLCFKKAATLKPRTLDRYGRTVARVECDGTDARRGEGVLHPP